MEASETDSRQKANQTRWTVCSITAVVGVVELADVGEDGGVVDTVEDVYGAETEGELEPCFGSPLLVQAAAAIATTAAAMAAQALLRVTQTPLLESSNPPPHAPACRR